KVSAVGTVFRLGSSPDPGPGAGVELGGGHPGGMGDLMGIGEGLPGQRLAPEDPPPAFLQVQPTGALGDEGMADAGMILKPGPVLLLSWLERLSVMITIWLPVGWLQREVVGELIRLPGTRGGSTNRVQFAIRQ